MSIKALEDNTAKKISTAQIVTSVSSVVKELVENALDAGSNSIEVILEEKGLAYIEVKDNGNGISSTDAQFMALPFYTSKLSSFSDLETITTYGFRGEALHSMCRHASVKIITRKAEDSTARLYTMGLNGTVEKAEISNRSTGTTVRVEGLFIRLPVRRKTISNKKFLNDDMKKLENLLKDFGICYPRLKLQLKVDGKVIFTKPTGNTLKDNLIIIYGIKFTSSYEFLKSNDHNTEIDLIIPKKDTQDFSNICHSNYSHIIVNNRPVTHKDLEKLISNLISEYFNAKVSGNKKKLDFFLIVKVPPSELDINLEPNKTQILFKDLLTIQNIIKQLIVNYYEMENHFEASNSNLNQTIDSSAAYPNTCDELEMEQPPPKKRKKTGKRQSNSNLDSETSNNEKENEKENEESNIMNIENEESNQMPEVNLGEDFSTQEINAIPVLNPHELQQVISKIDEINAAADDINIPDDVVFSEGEDFPCLEKIGEKQDSVLSNLRKGLAEVSDEDWSRGHCSDLQGGVSVEVVNKNEVPSEEDTRKDYKVGNAHGFRKFSDEMRPKIIKNNPGINLVEVAHSLSNKWKKLKPEERRRYRETAVREENAKAAFVANKKLNSSGQSSIRKDAEVSQLIREKNKNRLMNLLNKKLKEAKENRNNDNVQKKTIISWEINRDWIHKKCDNIKSNLIIGKLKAQHTDNIWLARTNNQIWALDSIKLLDGLEIETFEREQNKDKVESIENYFRRWIKEKDDMNLFKPIYDLKNLN